MPRSRISVVAAVVVAASAFATAAEQDRPQASVAISVEVDLGQDRGQSRGSLFEARDADGRVVAGAGFHDVYNTHFRTDRNLLQVYVRPATGSEPVLERLPYPDLGFGAYLFDVDGELYAWSSIASDNVRRWDNDAGQWLHETPPGCPSVRTGDGATRVAGGLLTFSEGQAHYDGSLILDAPEVGAYSDFYCANGYLCFYHRDRSETNGFTHILACPWTPGEGPVELANAVILDTKYDFETTFAWGQWNDEVITVGNSGGVYVLKDGAWRVDREPDRTVSYQVYSMLRRNDRLLMAQYPSGHVFEYRGESPVEMPGWPPRLEGVAPSARECQTLAIYNGNLFAGVWPWAELWRLDDADRWHSHGRLFTHPETTAETQHPYEAESKRTGVVLNHWGQRISGMVPLGDALYISTSAKGTGPWPENVDFLSPEQRNEYGAVLRLRMPGNLATPIQWPEGKTRFEFVIGPDSLTIRQDGKDIASTSLTAGGQLTPEKWHFTWGDGIHGPLRGRMIEHAVSREAVQR